MTQKEILPLYVVATHQNTRYLYARHKVSIRSSIKSVTTFISLKLVKKHGG